MTTTTMLPKHKGAPRGFDRPAYYLGFSMILTAVGIALGIVL